MPHATTPDGHRELWNFIALVEAGKWTPGHPVVPGASPL